MMGTDSSCTHSCNSLGCHLQQAAQTQAHTLITPYVEFQMKGFQTHLSLCDCSMSIPLLQPSPVCVYSVVTPSGWEESPSLGRQRFYFLFTKYYDPQTHAYSDPCMFTPMHVQTHACQMAPYSQCSPLLLTRAHRALIKVAHYIGSRVPFGTNPCTPPPRIIISLETPRLVLLDQWWPVL